MRKALSPPSGPQLLPFNEFLAALFQSLEAGGIRPCILRNYEGFPGVNTGGDIDFLIVQAALPNALRAVHSIPGIRIVGFTRRAYVASVFLEGVTSTPGSRSLQLDFLWSLSWKGMPYLPPNKVFQSARPLSAENLKFFVPSPVHEAIVSLLTSLIFGGWAKEKYLPKTQLTFNNSRTEAIAVLQPQFGQRAATRLVDTVIEGDRQRMHGCVWTIRFSLAIRSLLRRPYRTVRGVVYHYMREIAVRFSPMNVETICFLGSDAGVIKNTIDKLMPLLYYAAKIVSEHQYSLEPRFTGEPTKAIETPNSAPQTQHGSIVSMAFAAHWLLDEWLNQFIRKKNDTLRIFHCYWPGLLINPERFRFGGPMWFAALIGKLAPEPDLWILLAPDPNESDLQKHLSTQSPRQLEAYRAFVETRKRHIVLDANLPIDDLTDRAHAAIIKVLAQLTHDRKLKGSLSPTRSSNQESDTANRFSH